MSSLIKKVGRPTTQYNFNRLEKHPHFLGLSNQAAASKNSHFNTFLEFHGMNKTGVEISVNAQHIRAFTVWLVEDCEANSQMITNYLGTVFQLLTIEGWWQGISPIAADTTLKHLRAECDRLASARDATQAIPITLSRMDQMADLTHEEMKISVFWLNAACR